MSKGKEAAFRIEAAAVVERMEIAEDLSGISFFLTQVFSVPSVSSVVQN